MSLQACADLLAQGDRDRYLATMAVAPAARETLLPLYAFNLEVARAPWVASEPMIGKMRLQWWRDVLEEIAENRPVRAHEVTTPLADVLDVPGARMLDALVAVRRWDLYTEAFEDEGHFRDYLDATGGALMWAAGRALGAVDESAFRRIGRASALANLFLAVPELEARGRKPLVDGRAGAVRHLAREALDSLDQVRLPKRGRAALLAGWRARGILKRAAGDPGRVGAGALEESEFRKRLSLLGGKRRLGL
ncbi:MAG: squalene/phytoene synthase family protein [Silicimonas sp.]|nr:squalene/phytoene synthase family protein [Silicimonas sp.]